MNKYGPKDYGPCNYLSKICSMKPSAELRPARLQQTDESDLMPYQILQDIERAFLWIEKVVMRFTIEYVI